MKSSGTRRDGGNRQGWVVPVGSPNPKGAMKFIDFVSRAEPQAVFARLMYYAPQNLKAFDLLEPEIAKQLPSIRPNFRIAHVMNNEWWSDNYAQVPAAWSAGCNPSFGHGSGHDGSRTSKHR